MFEVVKQMVGIAEKVLPDNDAKREILARLEEGWMGALSASDTNQTNMNLADAASSDKYRTRARPTALWVCVLGLMYDLLAYPMLVWFCVNWELTPPPKLDQNSLYALSAGLLGLSAARSHDIWRGKR